MQSSRPEIYAGGDIVRGGATVILAMGDGRRAAHNMDKQLMKEINNEWIIYNHITHTKQCVYDTCLVWAFKTSSIRNISKWPMIGVILFHGVLHSLSIAAKFLQIASDSKITEAPLILYNLKLFKNV